MKALLLVALTIYQRGLSPLLPAACRFEPSCSEYARTAIVRHGAWRGTWQAMGRLLRCHPWHSGGCDPAL